MPNGKAGDHPLTDAIHALPVYGPDDDALVRECAGLLGRLRERGRRPTSGWWYAEIDACFGDGGAWGLGWAPLPGAVRERLLALLARLRSEVGE